MSVSFQFTTIFGITRWIETDVVVLGAINFHFASLIINDMNWFLMNWMHSAGVGYFRVNLYEIEIEIDFLHV